MKTSALSYGCTSCSVLRSVGSRIGCTALMPQIWISLSDTAALKSFQGAVRLKNGLNTLIVSVRPSRFRKLVGN